MEATFKSDFVTANGIRLHYLDWGGPGPTHSNSLVFLHGIGCNPYIFSRFAPRFTDRFHVFGFCRRGHGDSDYPETGYDADTLTEDLHQFLDALGIEQSILAGHSMAYIELSRYASLYPQRVRKLILLDANDLNDPERRAVMARNPLRGLELPWPDQNPGTFEDYAATLTRLYPMIASVWGEVMALNLRHNIKRTPDGGWIDKMTDAINLALSQTLVSYDPHYESITAPMLRVFAIADGTDFLSPDYMTEEQRASGLAFWKNELIPYSMRSIEKFHQAAPQAHVAVIEHGHHFCFIKNEEEVYVTMRAFLEQI